MPLWQWALDGLGVVLVSVGGYGVCLVLRRRWIARAGNTFELSRRDRTDRTGRGWVLGLGRYSGEVLEFFRIFSVTPRPTWVIARAGLSYDGQRPPVEAEAHSLYVDHVILQCRGAGGPFELAMTPDAATGFLAWLEAGPPGGPRMH